MALKSKKQFAENLSIWSASSQVSEIAPTAIEIADVERSQAKVDRLARGRVVRETESDQIFLFKHSMRRWL